MNDAERILNFLYIQYLANKKKIVQEIDKIPAYHYASPKHNYRSLTKSKELKTVFD